jgi:hypothetical protein
MAFMGTGALHVLPPSTERENAMPSRTPLLKRESCHAATSTPLAPLATDAMSAPSRIARAGFWGS